VVDVTASKPLLGMAVTEALNGRGTAVTKVSNNIGMPVSYVVDGGYAALDPASAVAVALSGNNLVATNTGTTSTNQGARVGTALGKVSGKFYFEMTFTTILNTGLNVNTGVGIGPSNVANYSTLGNTGSGGAILPEHGGSVVNGSGLGNFGQRASGDVIGIAVDLTNHQIWFRVAPIGNWNVSGTANPATTAGGYIIPSSSLVPVCVFGNSLCTAGNVITANLGSSAFSGAVPAGFTAGWI
jgi:hypothetical protein